MLEAVIFDMDGVLVDSEPLHYQTDMIMLNRLGIRITDGYLDRFIGVSNTEMWSQICADFGAQADIARILSEQLELKIALLKQGDYSAMSGVSVLIEDIRKNGLPVGVASSSQPEFIDAVLEKIGLASSIDRRVSGESVARGKPEPDIFLKAAALLGAAAENCLVIEDSKNGVLAAKKAGMKCIGYKNPATGNQDLSLADLVIDDFTTLTFEKLQTV